MPNLQRTHRMDELKKKLEQILEIMPPESKIYYIDYPVHSNCGDLLIMKGTEAFFKDYRIQVAERYSVHDFNEQTVIPKDHIIVLHGGGNFGDLYEAHQRLRENIIRKYPEHRIIILPQTIFFKEETALRKTAEVFSQHSDLHLFVRDEPSYQIAKENFKGCHVSLIPDMAHQLWPIERNSSPRKERLNFYRTDIEKAAEPSHMAADQQGDFLDWPTLYNRYERKLVYWLGLGLRKGRGRRLLQKIWMNYSDYLVNKAIRCFSEYEMIHSSRLHGHILSCLMAKPNLLIDNSYGKNSGYYRIWTHQVNTATLDLSSAKKSAKIDHNYMESTVSV